MKEFQREKRLVLNSGVLVEYVVKRAPYRMKVENLFNESFKGNIKLYTTLLALSETLYIISKIYKEASIPKPNEEALNYIIWLKTRLSFAEITEEIAIRAGELKKKLGIALPDCYVIASAEALNAVPVFRKVEAEMTYVHDKLKQYNIKFLEEF
jgi:predicted nucleic acid-binding protein